MIITVSLKQCIEGRKKLREAGFVTSQWSGALWYESLRHRSKRIGVMSTSTALEKLKETTND